MIELVSLIIFCLSLAGLGIMVFRKIPKLLEMPDTPSARPSLTEYIGRAKELPPVKGFSSEVLLQKILSKVRVLTLKTDHKTSSLLQKLRENSRRKKISEDDNYWKEIKDKFKE